LPTEQELRRELRRERILLDLNNKTKS